jgi:hypothetical protein
VLRALKSLRGTFHLAGDIGMAWLTHAATRKMAAHQVLNTLLSLEQKGQVIREKVGPRTFWVHPSKLKA